MLQVARAAIHNERMLEHHAKNFQSALAAFKIIVPGTMLLNSDNDGIVNEAIQLLTVILEDGNSEVQSLFYEYFRSTREETFFADVRGLIQSCMDEIVEVG